MTDGIKSVYLETHNWGKTVKFWQQLGYEVELDLGSSGRLVHKSRGASLFIQEIASDRSPTQELYLGAPTADLRPIAPADVSEDWHDSHWGTQLMVLKDPDGRRVVLEHGSAD